MDPFYAFLIFAALLVLEYLAANAWLPVYYSIGIPVFHHSAVWAPGNNEAGLISHLGSTFKSGPTRPTIHFRQIQPGLIALREVLFESRPGIRFIPVMHMALRIDHSEGQVNLTGYLNLSILFILVYLVYRGTSDASFLPVAVLILFVLALSYFSQAALGRSITNEAGGQANR